jgi:hypothetical protein
MCERAVIVADKKEAWISRRYHCDGDGFFIFSKR